MRPEVAERGLRMLAVDTGMSDRLRRGVEEDAWEAEEGIARLDIRKRKIKYLCACLLSSCRRVRAGFESGFGPRRFGLSPSV